MSSSSKSSLLMIASFKSKSKKSSLKLLSLEAFKDFSFNEARHGLANKRIPFAFLNLRLIACE